MTAATYTLVELEVRANISITASYMDGQGTFETVASSPASALKDAVVACMSQLLL